MTRVHSPSAHTQPGAAASAAYHVFTWGSATDGAVARIRLPMAAAKGKTKLDWLPVVIHAETEALAAERAHAFFASEQERLAKRDAGHSRRVEAARATIAARKAAASETEQPGTTEGREL